MYSSNIANDLVYVPGSVRDVILKFKGHKVTVIILPHEGKKKKAVISLNKLLLLLEKLYIE